MFLNLESDLEGTCVSSIKIKHGWFFVFENYGNVFSRFLNRELKTENSVVQIFFST